MGDKTSIHFRVCSQEWAHSHLLDPWATFVSDQWMDQTYSPCNSDSAYCGSRVSLWGAQVHLEKKSLIFMGELLTVPETSSSCMFKVQLTHNCTPPPFSFSSIWLHLCSDQEHGSLLWHLPFSVPHSQAWLQFLNVCFPDFTPFQPWLFHLGFFTPTFSHFINLSISTAVSLLLPIVRKIRHCLPCQSRLTLPSSPLLTMTQPHWPFFSLRVSTHLFPSHHPLPDGPLLGRDFLILVFCHLFREAFPDSFCQHLIWLSDLLICNSPQSQSICVLPSLLPPDAWDSHRFLNR